MFERDHDYLASMTNERLAETIRVNQERLAKSNNGTEPFNSSIERLDVFMPEATLRGLGNIALTQVI